MNDFSAGDAERPGLPTPDDARAAHGRITGRAIRTPLLRLNHPALPATLHLKPENLQPIGSFKIRGAANAMARLSPDALGRGVVTASAGNMAQGVAWCARELGIPCTVIAPETAAKTKLRAVEGLGGRVIVVSFDAWFQAFRERRYEGVDGTFIHAFDDPDVMAGNGTIALEILEDCPEVDTILVPWGGGGLACGIAAVAKALKPSCRVLAVEVETSAALTAAFGAGEPVEIPYTPSFVDGIGSRRVFPQMFERARLLLDGTIVATLDEVAAAVRLLLARSHLLTEGAGATSVACALKSGASAGTTVCILSGGNIDFEKLAPILRSGS